MHPKPKYVDLPGSLNLYKLHNQPVLTLMKKYTIRLSQEAVSDIEDIHDYIAYTLFEQICFFRFFKLQHNTLKTID